MRRTKIVATLGPASSTEPVLAALLEAGFDVARFNFSHGTHRSHRAGINQLRALAKRLGHPVAILQDLSGPKLRVGEMADGVVLRAGQTFLLRSEAHLGNGDAASINYPVLLGCLKPGMRVLIDEGLIELKVIAVSEAEARCRVATGGPLSSHKGVNMPGCDLPIAAATEKDLADLALGLQLDVDWIAMSFVRRASDLDPLRQLMKQKRKTIPILAKIEQQGAVHNLDEIIAASDGIMVARGDLGIELPPEEVPPLQKRIIQKCNRLGKPVIVATQMLDSMIRNSRPTRAEASDVANAIFDGADAVMLSGETAAGRFPVEALRVMNRVAKRTEKALDFSRLLEEKLRLPSETVTDAISQAACAIADDLGARAILASTSTGHTAFMVARNRPRQPIIALTENVATERRLLLAWGICPLPVAKARNTDEMVRRAIAAAKERKFAKDGDTVVVIAGVPAGVPGQTNLIKVEIVGRNDRI